MRRERGPAKWVVTNTGDEQLGVTQPCEVAERDRAKGRRRWGMNLLVVMSAMDMSAVVVYLDVKCALDIASQYLRLDVPTQLGAGNPAG